MAPVIPTANPSSSPASLRDQVIRIANDLGFDECRIAPASQANHAADFDQWLADGCHGEMNWMERDPQRRADPREVLPGSKSVIVLALNYFQGPHNPRRKPGVFARYAWGEDYHPIIEKKLKALNAHLESFGGRQRYYVDTGPVLERDFASESGLGWNGKSTMQLHRRLGTWFFLAEIITTLDLPRHEPSGHYCGKCTQCIDACPTQAITRSHRLDARKCISYLTIELKGAIPEEFRTLIGDRIFGCDDCLSVCPWNRFAREARETRFSFRENVADMELRDFLALDDDSFRALFAKSPVKRIKRPAFLRNVCVALGNVGTADDLPALRQAARDPDPLIADHARWAIGRIAERSAAA